MDARKIADLLRVTPFAPFRIVTTRTGHYDVRSPEGVLVQKSKVYLPVGLHDGVADDVEQVPIAQISAIKPL